MVVSTQWVSKGKVIAQESLQEHIKAQEDLLIQREGYVCLLSTPTIREVRWAVFSPNWSSLFYAMSWIKNSPPPYRLRYFIAGWCEEIYQDALEACDRIDEIIAKSDIHISTRTFVKEVDPGVVSIPDLLHNALITQAAKPEFTVDCALDGSRFAVQRVGTHSAIAQIWGLNPSSYPCRSGNSYDQLVSAAYQKVLKTGEPHYDHVMASMVTPDQIPIWVPYQRVVLPHLFPDGRKGVSVLSSLCDVDIKLL